MTVRSVNKLRRHTSSLLIELLTLAPVPIRYFAKYTVYQKTDYLSFCYLLRTRCRRFRDNVANTISDSFSRHCTLKVFISVFSYLDLDLI